MKTLAEKFAVMQAAERGEKIEIRIHQGPWRATKNSDPLWNWVEYDYRVTQKPLEIVVVARKVSPRYPFVLNLSTYQGRHDKDDLLLLNQQTITY